jgi:hypothetical protein
MAFNVTDVQKALKGADYPASKEELADLAEQNDADQDLIDAIRGLGRDEFDGPDDVQEAFRGQLTGRG